MISRRDFMKGIVQTTVAFAATTPSLLRAECIGREPIVQWLRGITLITTTDAFQVAKDSTMNLEVIVNFGSWINHVYTYRCGYHVGPRSITFVPKIVGENILQRGRTARFDMPTDEHIRWESSEGYRQRFFDSRDVTIRLLGDAEWRPLSVWIYKNLSNYDGNTRRSYQYHETVASIWQWPRDKIFSSRRGKRQYTLTSPIA